MRFVFLVGALLGAGAIPTVLAQQSEPGKMSRPALALSPGDLIVRLDGDGWRAVRILLIDAHANGMDTAHCLTYRPSKNKPTVESMASLEVAVWHAPILASSFRTDWERVGNQPVSKAELVGFIEYLKHTDFPRYAEVTGQDPNTIVHLANQHYQQANQLSEQGKKVEAIAEYTLAVELFPLFYEAIDNRAFTHMELGDYRAALSDFEESLQVNPDGFAAFFSRGECLMRLGQLAEAEAVFKEGITRFPAQRASFQKYLEIVQSLTIRSTRPPGSG